MPAKPIWSERRAEIISALRALPPGPVTRAAVEEIFRVGPRRAQQILQPCLSTFIGTSGAAERETLIAHLERLVSGEDVHYEHQRRRRVAQQLARWQSQPRLLVERPVASPPPQLAALPEGVELEPGSILVRFSTAQEALEKLLALAMAIGQDLDAFTARVGGG
jgi:hypothetical protein